MSRRHSAISSSIHLRAESFRVLFKSRSSAAQSGYIGNLPLLSWMQYRQDYIRKRNQNWWGRERRYIL
jgi:hypothetical protein